MKNKKYILTIITAVILSACNLGKNKLDTEIQKNDKLDKKSLKFSGEPAVKIGKSITEKLAELPENTELFSGDNLMSLTKNTDGKWEYEYFEQDEGLTLSLNFTEDEFKQEGDFDVIKSTLFKIISDQGDNYDVDVKITIPKTNLTYGHYGFIEELDANHIGAYPFLIGQKDKIKFEPPQKDIKFSGLTHAVLNRESGKEIKDLKGMADMIIKADASKGDIMFKYDNWDKTVKVTGYDFVNRDDKYKLEVSGLKVDKENSKLQSFIFDNKEAIGTYEFKMTDGVNKFALDGGFGIKKE